MSLPTGIVLSAQFEYFKTGVPYDPSVLPTIIDSRYPDGTVGPTPALTHTATGVFTANVFTALQSTQIGTYSATAYTTDTTTDNGQYTGWQWTDVGINNVTSIQGTTLVAPVTFANPVNLAQTVVGPLIPGNDYVFSLGTQLPFVSPYLAIAFTSITYEGQLPTGGTLPIAGVLTSTTAGYVELPAATSIQLVQGSFSVLGKTAGGLSLTWAWGVQIMQPVRS